MPDLTPDLLPDLRQTRLPDLPLPDDLLAPAYNGGSIANIPASIAAVLGAPPFGMAPLALPGLAELAAGAQRVVVLLMDSLALQRFQNWLPDSPLWQRLMAEGLLAPLTSIVPSTTAAALTALWTGAAPAAHGITGYEMWLREYNLVANMISHHPIAFRGRNGNLTSEAGFDPKGFLPLPTLDTHLAAHGIATHAFHHHSIAYSSLSQMLFPAAERHAFFTPAEFSLRLGKLLEDTAGAPLYVWSYWSEVDTLSHFYGPDAAQPRAEFAHFSQALERYLFNDLSPAARKDTLFILTADHGGLLCRTGDPHYMLSNHPGLARRALLWAGESRLPFMYVRPGQMEAAREYVEKTWPNQFIALEATNALHAGLFGPPPFHEELLTRIGDLVLIPRQEAFIWWHRHADWLVGRHGGLHPQEMLVPLLVARLG